MKYLNLLAFAALAAALLTGCEEKEELFTGFKIDRTSVTMGWQGGNETLGIKTDKDWSLSLKDDSWCTVSPKSGSGSATITITAGENPSKDGERSEKIILSYDGISLPITVTQEKNPGEAVFSITPNSASVPPEGGNFEFTVISDAAQYEITIVDGWIEEVSRSGDRFTGETITFHAAANEWPEDRMGVVSVCTENGSCIPVTVNQAKGNPTYVHHDTGYRFTATWCGYCPYMDEAFHTFAQSHEDYDYLTFHSSKGYPLYFGDSGTLMTAYDISGFPTGVMNGWKEISNSSTVSTTVNNMNKAADDFAGKFPCTAGIGIASNITDDKLSVEATVETSVNDGFLVAAFILESGIIQAQTYYPPTGATQNLTSFQHDNVARATLTGSPLGDSFEATAGTPVKFTWEKALDSSWSQDNLSVAVLVLRPYGAYASYKAKTKYPDTYVVNSRIAAAGSHISIEYEK